MGVLDKIWVDFQSIVYCGEGGGRSIRVFNASLVKVDSVDRTLGLNVCKILHVYMVCNYIKLCEGLMQKYPVCVIPHVAMGFNPYFLSGFRHINTNIKSYKPIVVMYHRVDFL